MENNADSRKSTSRRWAGLKTHSKIRIFYLFRFIKVLLYVCKINSYSKYKLLKYFLFTVCIRSFRFLIKSGIVPKTKKINFIFDHSAEYRFPSTPIRWISFSNLQVLKRILKTFYNQIVKESVIYIIFLYMR